MRKVIPALTLGLLCASAMMAAWACSSDSTPATSFQDSGPLGDGAGADDTGNGGDGSSGTDTGGGGGDGAQNDGPPIVFLDGGPDVGPVPCVAGGMLETEPNNDVGEANTVTGNVAMCGQITRTDDGGLDEDDFAFHIQSSTTTMSIEFNGNVTLTVTVETDGGPETTVITPTSTNTPVPFVRDKQYTIVVRSFDGNPQNYRFTIHES